MKKEVKKKTRNRKLIGAALITVAAFIVVHAKVQHVKVPSELVGTWRTTAAGYDQRSFEISYETVNFDLGEGAVSTGFIEDIQSTSGTEGTLYTVAYKAEGTASQVSFYYDGNGDKTIRFKNQSQIPWSKQADD